MSNITSIKFRKGKIDIVLTGGGTGYSNVEVKENGQVGGGTGNLYIGCGVGGPQINQDDTIVILNTTLEHIVGLVGIATTVNENKIEIVVNPPMEQNLFDALNAISTINGTSWTAPLSNYFNVKPI